MKANAKQNRAPAFSDGDWDDGDLELNYSDGHDSHDFSALYEVGHDEGEPEQVALWILFDQYSDPLTPGEACWRKGVRASLSPKVARSMARSLLRFAEDVEFENSKRARASRRTGNRP